MTQYYPINKKKVFNFFKTETLLLEKNKKKIKKNGYFKNGRINLKIRNGCNL